MSEQYKKQAAQAAVELIESGMVVGLGHGSTVQFALEALAERIKTGELKNITGIPASKHTQTEATRLGIPLVELGSGRGQIPYPDLTIDGADEVDPQLNLIKGGGGALLREKILAQASRKLVIMVGESKLSGKLGTKHSLPVEVAPFGGNLHLDFISELGGKPQTRADSEGKPVLTDQGNHLLDCKFDGIDEPEKLAARLKARAGIIEHGLFLGMASEVIAAGPAGIRRLKAQN